MSRGFTISAADFFCGGGGASEGVLAAGVDLRFAANHDAIAIATHAANHPRVDHFHVDLLDYDVARLPAVRLAHFSPSCKHHSQANARKVYEQPRTLFDFLAGDGGAEEARSGYAGSERSRVTMSCVIRYAAAHRPEVLIVENVVEAAKWGPNRDGTTFRWWRNELHQLGYRTQPVFLNSALFGVPQLRDRMFVVCWRGGMRAPELSHHTRGWCPTCDCAVEARQTFRRPTNAWPLAEWGKLGRQYDYRCTSCHTVVALSLPAAATVIDWSDLGTRLGDRDRPLADSTLERIRRGLARFGGRPPFVTLTRSDAYGPLGWPIDEPCGTVTTRHDQALVSGCQVVAAGNTFERDGSTCRSRPLSDPSWAIHTTPAFGVAFQIEAMLGMHNGGWAGNRYRGTDRPAPTVTTTQVPGLVTHRGAIIPFRRHTHPTDLAAPAPTQTAQQIPGLALWPELGAMFAKNNGEAHDTVYHPTSDPFGTVTAADTTSLVTWLDNYRSGPHPVGEPAGTVTCVERQALATTDAERPIDLDDVRFRMLKIEEIRRVMKYPDDFRFAGPDDTEPSNRDKVRLLGDGVTPPVLTWLTDRTLDILDQAS